MPRLLLTPLIALVLLACADTASAADRPGLACLRPGAGGTLTVLAQNGSNDPVSQLFGATTDATSLLATTSLGDTYECADAAGGGDTTAVAAESLDFSSQTNTLRAALRTGTGPFEAPVVLDTFKNGFATSPRVAVGPRGDVAVTWIDDRIDPKAHTETSVRIRIARRPAGGRFGPAETVAALGVEGANEPAVAVGVDGSGTTTVLWASPLPDTNGDDDTSIETATAPSGVAFGTAQRLTGRIQELNDIALAVGPTGAAVAAWTSNAGIAVAERRVPSSGFGPLHELVSSADPGNEDLEIGGSAAAIDAAGDAFVSWLAFDRDDLIAEAARHPAGGDFGTPQRLWSQHIAGGTGLRAASARHLFGDLPAGEPDITVGPPGLTTPLPPDETATRALLTDDGRMTLTWLIPRQIGDDSLPAAWSATGTIAAGFGAARRISGDCRPAEGATPLTAAPDPLIAWIDDATDPIETFSSVGAAGRLHVQRADAAQPTVAPAIKLTATAAPGVQTVYSEQPLKITASCDRACDLRAWVPGAYGEDRAATGAALEGAGRVRLGLVSQDDGEDALVPKKPGRVTIRVRACDASGLAEATASVAVRASRRPVLPLVHVSKLHARRSGKKVIVTWHTDRAAKRQTFLVATVPSRAADVDDAFTGDKTVSVEGGRRRVYRARLPADRKRYVMVLTLRQDPPQRNRIDTVRIGR